MDRDFHVTSPMMSGPDSDGGEVMRRVRLLTQVDGFGRVE